jgi:hypothetical protein
MDSEYTNMPMLSTSSPKNPLQRTIVDLIVHKVHNYTTWIIKVGNDGLEFHQSTHIQT